MPRSRFLRLLLFVTFALPLLAQQPAPNPPIITFHSQTELVSVPVIVMKDKREHLIGLKQSDFTLEEDGHPRQIASFEEITPSTSHYGIPSQRSFPYTNFIRGDVEASHVNIILLDLLNTPFVDQGNARKQLIHFLAHNLQGAGPTSLAVLTGRGLREIHSFTTDTTALIAALKKLDSADATADDVNGGFGARPRSKVVFADSLTAGGMTNQIYRLNRILNNWSKGAESSYLEGQQIDITLAALKQIAKAFAGIPGRKSLIWVTRGLPSEERLRDVYNGYAGDGELIPVDYSQLWQSLNAANIAVYPIDPEGLVGQYWLDGSPQATGIALATLRPSGWDIVEQRQLTHLSLLAFAHATGGKACINTNDVSRCFARAESDSSQYYLLSYYLQPQDRTAGWHSLKVHVRGEHGQVRARRGFFIAGTKHKKPETVLQQVDLAGASPVDYTSVPVGLRINALVPAARGTRKLSFTISVQPNGATIDTAANNFLSLDFDAVAQRSDGNLTRVFGRAISAHLKPQSLVLAARNGFAYSGVVILPPGKFRAIRFIVRDRLSGKIGTVTAPLQMP